MCFANVALVTDYDVGVDDIAPVSHAEVLKVFGENIDALRDLLFAAIPSRAGRPERLRLRARPRRLGSRLMARQLVRIELAFVSEEDAEQMGERIREAVAMIVGRDALEEFRVRTLPLDTKKKDHLRPVD